MNLSQVKQLKTGDKVTFQGWPWRWTKGKTYSIKETDIGRFVETDTGIWKPIASDINLEMYFEKEPL